MLFEPALLSALSGRLGGTVFSHNRHGPYAKAWVQPDETATSERQAVWDAMAALGPAWAALTPAQRAAWTAFSHQTPRRNRIGRPHPAGGFQEFTRANIIRLQCNNLLGSTFAQVSTPPTDPALNPTVPEGIFYAAGDSTFEVIAPDPRPYSNDEQAGVAFWASEARPAAALRYHGNWTLVAVVTPPQENLADVTLPMAAGVTASIDQVFFVKSRYFDEFGNLRLPVVQRIVPS